MSESIEELVERPPSPDDWGWWSVFGSLHEFKKMIQVPDPFLHNPLVRASGDLTPSEMQELLVEFGGYMARLEGFLGDQRARVHALNESYEAAVMVAAADPKTTEGMSKSASERSKEAKALREVPELRDVKKFQIEARSILILAEGWKEAYAKAWETVSRLVTIHIGDITMQTGRRP